MNQSTAKLLKSYASLIGEHERGIKKWWGTLSSTERYKWRKKIQEELAADENEAQVEETAQIEEVAE